MKIVAASDTSLLVEFGNTVSQQMHWLVIGLFRALHAEGDPRIRNLHPGYASLLIDFDVLRLSHEQLGEHVRELIEADTGARHPASRAIEIPVCYDAELGPDLGDVAAHNEITIDEVIRLHTSATYLVYFLGFSQTGVYPIDSPGGWRLIGRTPERMFDASADQPTRLEPGDLVQFTAISRSTFEQMLARKPA
jgi:allophanate hydrolase subunit 1